MSRHLAWSTAITLLAVVAATMMTPLAAKASTSTASTICDNNFGKRTPLLLVHGFHESTGVWRSMITTIKNDSTLQRVLEVVPPFDYPNTQWVTDPNVGAKLASVISCLARDSKANGGPGQIIIVAHSMGGLAVRCALASSCVGTGHQAVQDKQVGLLITMGTPNLGSLLATTGDALSETGGILCGILALAALGIASGCPDLLGWLFGANSPAAQAMEVSPSGQPSQQLAALPSLPSDVPLYAMAGQVTVTTSLFGLAPFQVSGPEFGDLGDLAVSVDSGLDGAPRVSPAYPGQQSAPHPGAGSGSVIMPCGTISISFLANQIPASLVPDLTCTHLSETTNAAWQQAAINAIKAYQATISQPITTPMPSSPPGSSPTPAPPTTQPPPPQPVTVRITVPADAGWVDTGLRVSPSDVVDISASGSWTPDGGLNYTGPEGFGYSPESPDNYFNVADLGACADCASTAFPFWGQLISYTGNSPPEPGSYTSTAVAPQASLIDGVGSSYQGPWPYSGELWLGFNDDAYSGNTSDNYGAVTATVTVQPDTGSPTPSQTCCVG